MDVGWLGPSKRRTMSEASVFVIVVEQLDALGRLISDIGPILKELYPEAHLIPPFLCFTSFTQEIAPSEGTSGKSGSEEDVEQTFIHAGLAAGIHVLPINRHLRQLRDRLYRDLCWKFPSRSKPDVDEEEQMDDVLDPFEAAVQFLRMGLLVHTAPS